MAATLAQLKAELRITDGSEDALLGQYIATVSAMVVEWTGIVEGNSVETRKYHAIEDVRGRDLIIDPWAKVSAITGDAGITSVINGDQNALAAGMDYVLVPPRRIRLMARSGAYWRWDAYDDPTDAIAVIGDFGYGDVAPPKRVRFELDVCKWLYRSDMAGGQGQLIINQGGTNVLQPSSLPAWAQELLDDLLNSERGPALG